MKLEQFIAIPLLKLRQNTWHLSAVEVQYSLRIALNQKNSGQEICLKFSFSSFNLISHTPHIASYTFFTRNVDQYKNTSLSQLYQPPRTPFSQNTYHQLLFSCGYCKVFKNNFFIEHHQKRCLQMFFKIVVLKSSANFTGKHLSWSLFLKKFQVKGLQLHKKKGSNTCVFL